MPRNELTRRGAIIAFPLFAAALAAQGTSDDYLHDRVHRKLNNHPFLRIRQLAVEVRDGVVTVRGTVRSQKVKARATKVAAIKGVTKVVNLLAVGA